MIGDPVAASLAEQLLGFVLMVLLIAAWGGPFAGAFGGTVLWLVERTRPNPPLWLLLLSGMGAAALYAACSIGLALVGQSWVFLAAPWATGLLDPEQARLHPEAPIIVAIILSGGVGGLTYWRVGRRRSAPARPSPPGGEGGPEGLG